MRILGLITARGGSKGIPGKNIKNLGGKPLLAYVAQDAKASRLLDRLVISTDDEQIAKVATDFGIEVPFIRPADLAQDHTPTLDVIAHCLVELQNQGEEFDAVCLLQPTSPFKPEGYIDHCINKFIQSNADCLITVLKVPHHFNPHWVFEENTNGILRIATGEDVLIPRRQDLPKAYYRDGSIYIFKKDNIFKQRAIVHGRTTFEISDARYYCNLDNQEDWRLAEKHFLIAVNSKHKA